MLLLLLLLLLSAGALYSKLQAHIPCLSAAISG